MEILIILILILLNGFLSMSEIGLVSARKSRLESAAKKGNKSADTALKLANNPDRFLSTIQIGITLIGILTGLYSGEAFAADLSVVLTKIDWLAPYAMTLSKVLIVIAVTYLTLVLGELVPKRLGMGFPERIATFVAQPMNIVAIIVTPFIWLLSKSTSFVLSILGLKDKNDNKVTEEEIKAIVREGYDTGEVQEVEQDIVERVFNLGDRNVASIMTHRSDLVWLQVEDTRKEVVEKVKENLYNTYPVVQEKLDNIVGVVFLKDLFLNLDKPDFSLEQIMHPAQFFPEKQSVYNALEQFKVAHVKYGIVTDEFGGVQGIVTLKDIMEALVGQVIEMGEELDMVQRADGSWLVDGQYSFYDFLEHFDLEELYTEYDFNTLSGLILDILERVPKTGEELSWMNFKFEIVDMDGVRIDKVLVTILTNDEKKEKERN